MKHKQSGSIYVTLVGILLLVVCGALAFTFLKNLNQTKSSLPTSNTTQSSAEMSNELPQKYVEFKDWRVRFSSDIGYTVRPNSNQTAYYISIQELTETCKTPDTPWLGIIQRFENPEEKQATGSYAGKSIDQIFGSKGKKINGKLYYFDTATQFCTRNTSNPAVEQAAKKLGSEIQSLEAY